MGLSLSATLLALMTLLGIGVVMAAMARRWTVPYTAMLVVCGMLLGWAVERVPALAPFQGYGLTPDAVVFLFLPTLVFESGLALDARQLLRDLAPVLTLAVPALLLSTAIIGAGLWQLSGISLPLALVFGALISATDPVAVVALFHELGTPLRLTVLVEGESLLNDATAIVVFKLLLGIVAAGGFTLIDSGGAVLRFLQVFLGGALFGVLTGALAAWLAMHLRAGVGPLFIVTLIAAYASFIVAEHVLHLSGVMSAVTTALVFGARAMPRINRKQVTVLHETWGVVALVCNTLLFLLIGYSVPLAGLLQHAGLIALAVLLLLAARAATVYSLVPLTTRVFSLPRISLAERHIMWWGGLKGGLAIAMVLSLPVDLTGADTLRYLTLGVVLFTLLVNAPTIRPLMARLGMDRLSDEEQAEMSRSARRATRGAGALVERFAVNGLLSGTEPLGLRKDLQRILAVESEPLTKRLKLRQALSEALKVELGTLRDLLRAEVIAPHVYYLLRADLRRERERLLQGPLRARDPARAEAVQFSPLLRLENRLLSWLRDREWAVRPLSRYLDFRLSRRLVQLIARLLMTQAVLDALQDGGASESRQQRIVKAVYQRRMQRQRRALGEIRADHDVFYTRFVEALSLRAALVEARNRLDREHADGLLGTKPWNRMARRIETALAQGMTPITETLDPAALMTSVPLLRDLSAEARVGVQQRLRSMNFLAGDTVVAAGEHGDALYLVVRGELVVTRQGDGRVLRHLGPGDCFGEIALLEDHVRSATVRVLRPAMLLRLARRDFQQIALTEPAIQRHLDRLRRERRGMD